MSLRRFRTPDRPACNLVTIPTALSWLNIFALDFILIDLFCDPCTATVLEPSARLCIALVIDTVLLQLAAACDCLLYFDIKWAATEYCEIWGSHSGVVGGFRCRGM